MLGYILALGAVIGAGIAFLEHKKKGQGAPAGSLVIPREDPRLLGPGDKVKAGDTVFVRANALLPITNSPEKAAVIAAFFTDFQAANVQVTKALPQGDGTILGFLDALPAVLDEAQIDSSATSGTFNDQSDFRNVRFPKSAVISILRNGERIV